MDYFKGTKGEWKASDNGFLYDIKSNSSRFAIVFYHGGSLVGEANARLISASPELLDAAVSSWILLSDIPEEFMDDFIKKTVYKLESSISKALGYKIGNK